MHMSSKLIAFVVGAALMVAPVLLPTQSAAQVIRNVSAPQAAELLKSDAAVKVLDIRTPREFRAGHIQSAINVDFYSKQFRQKLAKLDPKATYVMHCKSGVRSRRSLKILRELGFTRIVHMRGGFDAWKRSKLTVAR